MTPTEPVPPGATADPTEVSAVDPVEQTAGEATGETAGPAPSRSARFAARFAALAAAVAGVLPFGLRRVVTGSVVGFAVINSCTFGIDLLILTVLHGGLRVVLPVAVSVGYACAFGLSFVLNRWLNFRSHAAVGRQVAWYVLAIVANYAVVLLGCTELLTALGVPYQLARVGAGACEAVFMYCALRWVVFRAPRPAAGRALPTSDSRSA
jgi:putative flippase GtrA